jgi:hypothetical protein
MTPRSSSSAGLGTPPVTCSAPCPFGSSITRRTPSWPSREIAGRAGRARHRGVHYRRRLGRAVARPAGALGLTAAPGNLSVTGARLRDVLTGQVPALAGLGDRVALVTVLAGANDMFPRGYARIADVFSRAIPWERPCA